MEKHYKAYLSLRKNIDTEVEKLETIHKNHLKCKAGCDLCCMDYGVFPIEFHHIRHKLLQLMDKPQLNVKATDEECIFLVDHKCAIYEERPIICRTHGLPLLYMGNDSKSHRVFFQTLSCRCTTDPTAIFQTGMFCYLIFPPRGTIREEFTYS